MNNILQKNKVDEEQFFFQDTGFQVTLTVFFLIFFSNLISNPNRKAKSKKIDDTR